MRVLHVLNKLNYSGAEIMYVDAAEEFKRLGCKLYVINSAKELGDYAKMFKDSGYEVLHLPYPQNFLAKWEYYRKIVGLVKKEKIDVIHTHSSKMKWGMALVARMAGIYSVYTFHNCFRSRFISYPYQWWLRWSAKHLLGCKFQTISDSVYNNELTYYHNSTTKIYNWFGNKRFFPAKPGEKQAVRDELNIPTDTFVIVSVGGCSAIKRHEDIINALPELAKKTGSILYLHLGQGNTTMEEKMLVKKMNIESCVRFLGNQENVRKYLIASDAYIMSSRFEGISITTIEAMACKIPAILYDVPGLRDFNNEKLCSLLIPEQSTEIVKAIHTLKTDDNKRKLIVENGYNLVMERYFLPNNVKKIYELYQ